ncbi:MAG: 16S rRNA (guanine(966)-N(2))-methyltransferase RsmD [Nodosilinea sp. LVE1205-7]|jgi:16S rRNA (guanine(966)-N(2))-methyltransferase RsmD
MLRVYGNRTLKTLPGLAIRPTSVRVRQAVCNIWQNQIQGCRWLDLCAGTGAMAAEALGRGAAEVVGIELSAEAYGVARQNWQKIAKPDQRITLFKGDVLNQLSRLKGQSFDLIYFDSPYRSGLYTPVLNKIPQFNLLKPEGEIAVEHSPKGWTAEPIAGLQLIREKHYGNTCIAFYGPA